MRFVQHKNGLRDQSIPISGSKSSKPTSGSKSSKPTYGSKSSKPTYGSKSSKPIYGSKSSKPTSGSKEGFFRRNETVAPAAHLEFARKIQFLHCNRDDIPKYQKIYIR